MIPNEVEQELAKIAHGLVCALKAVDDNSPLDVELMTVEISRHGNGGEVTIRVNCGERE